MTPTVGAPLSVTHVTTFYPPHTFGGDGVQVRRLAAAQARRGHAVRVVYAPAAYSLLGGEASAAPPAADPGVDVETVRDGGALEAILVQQTSGPVLARQRLRTVLGEAAGDRRSVLHFHNVSLVTGLRGLAMGAGVKLMTPHEYWLACPTSMLFRYEREPCERRTCIRCTLRSGRPPQLWRYFTDRSRHLRSIDCMVYASDLCRRIHREQGVERPDRVLHHFLPDSYCEAAARVGPRRGKAEPYALYVGRLEPVKGIDRLLEAHRSAGSKLPLWVAGDGGLRPRLVARYRDDATVRFLGPRRPEELAELYRDAAAVVLPSAGYEVFGLVVAEGFAHGTPAVVSAVGGAAEVVRAAGAGEVCEDPIDMVHALERLVADPDRRDAMGAAGREYVRSALNESSYMERYEALVDELLDV